MLAIDIETAPGNSEDMLRIYPPKFKTKKRKPEEIEKERQLWEVDEQKNEKWLDELTAASTLDPIIGQIAGIGMTRDGKNVATFLYDEVSEEEMLRSTFHLIKDEIKDGGIVVLFAANGVDIPFLWVRGLIHGITPNQVSHLRMFTGTSAKGYLNENIVDVAAVVGQGGRYNGGTPICSLTSMARAFGVGSDRKVPEDSGKYWYKMLAEDRPSAVEYLCDDVRDTFGIGQALLKAGAIAEGTTPPRVDRKGCEL